MKRLRCMRIEERSAPLKKSLLCLTWCLLGMARMIPMADAQQVGDIANSTPKRALAPPPLAQLQAAAKATGPMRLATIRWEIDTTKLVGDGQSFLFPLPVEGYGQKISYNVTGASKVVQVTELTNNNMLRIFPESRHLTITLTHRMRFLDLAAQLKEYKETAKPEYPAEVLPYLKTTYGLDQNTPKINALAKTLKREGSLETVKSVLRYVGDNVKYDFKYWRTTDEILDHKVTQCEGRSAVVVALLRNLGIPARMIFMVSPNKPPGNVVDGHTIAQFYLPGAGWLIGDPSTGDKLMASVSMNYGEEPIPYYYCRVGMGALVQPGESLRDDYAPMWSYLQKPQNRKEMMVAACMFDFFKVMYDCKVVQEGIDSTEFLTATDGVTPAQLRTRLENTRWAWPGMMQWFRLKPGSSVENRSNGGRGHWNVNSDASLTLSFNDKGSTYRVVFTKDLRSFHATGIDNTEVIDAERLE